MYLVVQKDLFGNIYTGPFDTQEEAVAYAATNNVNLTEWHQGVSRMEVKPLREPRQAKSDV